jgi:hypothetical protein
MSFIKGLSILFALGACGTGLAASWLWFLASKNEIDYSRPLGSDRPREALGMIRRSPAEEREYLRLQWQEIEEHNAWIFAAWVAWMQSADLNKKAAMWTAISAGLSGISAACGAFG